MRNKPLADAFRMGVFEAIDGLIIIANNTHGCIVRQKLNNPLFCTIQVLKFVHDDMCKLRAFGCARI